MTEIMVWLVRCGLVAAVLTAGAWLWETAARWSGRSARWGWLGALAGSVTIPLLLPLLPEAGWREAVPAVGVVRLDELAVATNGSAGSALELGAVAVGLWIVLSALLVGYTAVLLARLRRARRGWQPAEVDGAEVLLSRNTGPAAVGIGRGAVVIPGWALELDAELRRLMLLHEREHVAAGDPRVLLGALMLVALMPWHPLVWLQFVRLRNAIELDCDVRVLRRGVDPAQYGSLLLEVGRRRGGGGLVLATFAEPRALLEERIRRIAAWPVSRRPVRAAALSIIALALFSSALLARVRVESPALPTNVLQTLGLPAAASTAPQLMATDTPPPDPRLTPYTKAPVVQNTAAVMRAMAERYPAQLRADGVGGTVSVWVLVGQQGEVREARLATSSGHASLDEAGVSVARMMEFAPALNGERVVQAWVEIPLTFSLLAHSVAVNAQPQRAEAAPGRGVPGEISQAPTFTPFNVAPELTNTREVQEALRALYPPLLRDAGIGGAPVLWYLIDETGSVVKTQVKESSGHAALDEAAQRLAATMRFRPARNRDENVPVWVAIPVMFTTRDAPPRAPQRVLSDTAATRERVPATALERPQAERARVPAPPGAQTATGAVRSSERAVQAQPESLPRRPRPEPSAIVGYTPPLVQPELKNTDEVLRALMRNYPPLLRDAGIGGTVWMRLLVDEEGKVVKQQVLESSGHDAFDEAALRIGEIMRFTPGRNGNEVVRSWIDLPISFSTK